MGKEGLRARRCPKCKRFPIEITEFTEWSMTFEVGRGGIIAEEGDGNPQDIVRVQATCSCGHVWVLKGIKQKDELEWR